MSSIKYPLGVNNGSIALALDEEVIGQAIKSALLTKKQERVLNNSYGSTGSIFDLLPSLPDFLNALDLDISYSMLDYGDMDLEFYGSMLDDGQVDVTVVYETPDTSGTVNQTI